jgi:hypothetical protein
MVDPAVTGFCRSCRRGHAVTALDASSALPLGPAGLRRSGSLEVWASGQAVDNYGKAR